MPSFEWLHVRIEGQVYCVAAAQALAAFVRSNGGQAMVPVADERFKIYTQPKFYSKGAERHAAYIAGRFCSVITDLELAADQREHTGIYDCCSLCGKCQQRCPVDAINKNGKAHMPCYSFLEEIKALHPPWYGCGKCQFGMPCESGIPPKNPKADYSAIKNIDNGN